MRNMTQDTTVILVDENDNKLGYDKKEVCHMGNGKHHRAIAIFIFNEKGQTLLQRRKHKRFDNVWDTAGATDVLHIDGHDESYEESGSRCMKKEWNTDVKLEKLFGFNYFEKYKDMCENEFCMMLAGRADESIEFNSEVAYGSKWISMEELAWDVENNPQDYTPWAIIAVEEFMKRPEGKKFL